MNTDTFINGIIANDAIQILINQAFNIGAIQNYRKITINDIEYSIRISFVIEPSNNFAQIYLNTIKN